jgi:hypothetical protein
MTYLAKAICKQESTLPVMSDELPHVVGGGLKVCISAA